MKRSGLLVLFLASVLLVQPVLADDWLEDLFGNKPKAYFGGVFSLSPVANSVGICYLTAPLDNETVTTTYLEQAWFTDQAFWQNKGLAELTDYSIVFGTHSTIFGRQGIQPFWGVKGYNLKWWGFNCGLGLYEVDDLIAKHINLTYDFMLFRTSLMFAFMF